MRYYLIILIFLLLKNISYAEPDLFENAVIGSENTAIDSDDESYKNYSYQINGYIRTVFFAGEDADTDELEYKAKYGELSLKLAGSFNGIADAYVELRHIYGKDPFKSYNDTNVREAYISLYLGNFDFIIGDQILVWGRADGINPTNNITPMNSEIRATDDDDLRDSNFLIRAIYNRNPLKLEGIWIPEYKASKTASGGEPFIDDAVFGEKNEPDSSLDNGAYAFKIHFEFPSFDGSFSYFNGFDVNPGMDCNITDVEGSPPHTELFQSSYRTHVIGADFSTTIGSFGLRGEFAYKRATDTYRDKRFVPNPEIHYVFGIDGEKDDFSIIVQYIGKYIDAFEQLTTPETPVEQIRNSVSLYNRIVSSQLKRITHSISMRPKLMLLNEILTMETLFFYNTTTEETYLNPKCTYDVVDDLKLIIGGEFYWGPEKTLYGMMEDQQSAVFIELKKSF